MLLVTLLLLLPFVTWLSWWATRIIIRRAIDWGLQDIPNHRSSHTLPTPRGGGAAIVVASLIGFLVLALGPALAHISPGGDGVSLRQVFHAAWGHDTSGLLIGFGAPLLCGAVVLALTGLRDDIRSLRVRDRLIAQVLAVGLMFFAIHMLMGSPISAALRLFWYTVGLPGSWEQFVAAGNDGIALALRAGILLILLAGCVWWINLFNFMDGIDGIAGSQAVFMLLAGVVVRSLEALWRFSLPDVVGPAHLTDPLPGLTASLPPDNPLSLISLVVAAAVIGFLIHNWAPASIFMGDAGSLFLGYAILVVAAFDVSVGILGANWHDWKTGHGPLAGMLQPLCTWLILGAAFITDATLALLRRLLRGENPGTPHRSHAYQRLSRYYASHHRATLVYCLINLCWLFPMAILATVHPDHAAETLIVAYLPLVLLAWHFGAGREEPPSRP